MEILHPYQINLTDLSKCVLLIRLDNLLNRALTYLHLINVLDYTERVSIFY